MLYQKNIAICLKNFLTKTSKHLFPLSLIPDQVIGSRLESQIWYGKTLHKISFQNLLAGKTQVHSGYDHSLANRQNHALQVQELTINFLSSVGLNFFIGGATAFAHDCGHVAFGHCGEKALDFILKDTLGGFDHHLMGAYIARYQLHLPPLIVEGIALHRGNKINSITEFPEFSEERQRFWSKVDFTREYLQKVRNPENQATFLETACVSLLDDIAYLGSDLETEIIRKSINYKELPVSFFNLAAERTSIDMHTNPENNVKEAFLDICMTDLKKNTLQNFLQGYRQINFSPEVAQMRNDLLHFAYKKIYETPARLKLQKYFRKIMIFCFLYFRKKDSHFRYQLYNETAQAQLDKEILLNRIFTLTDRDAFNVYLHNNHDREEKKELLSVLKKNNIAF